MCEICVNNRECSILDCDFKTSNLCFSAFQLSKRLEKILTKLIDNNVLWRSVFQGVNNVRNNTLI